MRIVKGMEKPAKKWKTASHNTAITGCTIEEAQGNKYLMNTLAIKHKSTSDVQIEVKAIEGAKFLCMSNDVY